MATDPHRQTAAKMFKVKEENVTPAQRARGKSVNYLAIYSDHRVVDLLLVGSVHVLTRRARLKLWLQSLWYPWPLRQFDYCAEEEHVTVRGWLHDNGTIYVTRLDYGGHTPACTPGNCDISSDEHAKRHNSARNVH